MHKKKTVILGGGNGTIIAIQSLKPFWDTFEISAVVSSADSGGSSGRLREEFGTLPPGDILRAILAFSPYDFETLKSIFHRNRFEDAGKLSGHNIGNLFLTLGALHDGNFMNAVKSLEQALEAQGHVYPATLDPVHLHVALSNGQIVDGEAAIDRPQYDRSLRIQKAWLEPQGHIYDKVRSSIEEADAIIVGPGSLYTSLIALLLVDGMREVLASSRAKIIFPFTNIGEANGETGPDRLSKCISEIETYLPRPIDLILFNTHVLSSQEKEMYQKNEWKKFILDPENMSGRKMSGVDFESGDDIFSFSRFFKIFGQLLYNAIQS